MKVDALQSFIQEEISPFIAELEVNLEKRLALFKKMSTLGLLSMTIPKEFGGQGLSTVEYLEAVTILSKADGGIGVTVSVTNMVAEAIYEHGSSEMRKRLLPKFSSGEGVPGAIAMTEKLAGSDIKSVETSAVLEDGAYFLSGEKQFITNGDTAKLLLVLGKIGSTKEITAFIVERDHTNVIVTKKEPKIGLLTANLVDLKFEKCRIPMHNRLQEEGMGLKVVLSSLDGGRLGVAAQAIGIAEAALEAAINYSKKRIQFGQAISNYQAISFRLADMHVKLEAAKGLLRRAAERKDSGESFTVEASTAKLFASEASQSIVNDSFNIISAYAYIMDCPIEKYWRDARATTIYEGTSDIQRLVISRALLA